MKFESRAEVFSSENAKQVETIYKERLVSYGIDESDILISTNGKIVSVIISELSNYSNAETRIPGLLNSDAHLAFWETYSQLEVLTKLQQAFNSDLDSLGSNNRWKRFIQLFNMETFKQPEPQFETCLLGYVNAKDTAAMNKLLDSARMENMLPKDLVFAWTAKENSEWKTMGGTSFLYGLIALKSTSDGKARIDKPVLADVKSEEDENSHSPTVTFTMEGADADAWQRMTRENTKKCVALVLDGSVYSWPLVYAEIPGGVCTISGNFTKMETQELVAVLSCHSLPTPMKCVESIVLP